MRLRQGAGELGRGDDGRLPGDEHIEQHRMQLSSSSSTPDVCLQMLRITSALHLDILESGFYVLQIIRG